MVGADHVGLLVSNAFNVSISRENIRPDLQFVETVRSALRMCRPSVCPRLTARACASPGVRRR
jgi:hypothetical protein